MKLSTTSRSKEVSFCTVLRDGSSFFMLCLNTSEPGNQEMRKPGNEETRKLGNQEMRKRVEVRES